MASDPFTHPLLRGLFGDDDVAALLSAETSLTHMLAVEAAFAQALGRGTHVPVKVAEAAAEQIKAFQPDMVNLRDGMAADGLVVPALINQLKAALPPDLHVALHTGLTSQDVIDTSLVLSLRAILLTFEARIEHLCDCLTRLDDTFGANPLQGRTRMQAALPITVHDRIARWQAPLDGHRARLDDIRPRLLVLQLGGPVGTRAGVSDAVAARMAATLDLTDPGHAWHNTRDAFVEFAGWLSRVTGSLGKIGVDIALMAQQGIDEIVIKGGGTSSAMPHKANPVLAETLVTLARYNATQLPGMHHAMVHEQERSGSAWALEWMILPAMIMATGSALNAATTLCKSITQMGEPQA